jgi:hypothetical protein
MKADKLLKKFVGFFILFLRVRIVSLFCWTLHHVSSLSLEKSTLIFSFFFDLCNFSNTIFSHEILILYWPNSLFFWKENY